MKRIQDLVLGAGAVGVNCALALAESGRDVAIVDRSFPCAECSYGNAGWITPCHSLPIPGPGLVTQTLKWMLQSDAPLYIKPSLRPSVLRWLWRFYRHCNAEAQHRGLSAMAALNQHVVPLTRELINRYQLECTFNQRGILYAFGTEKGLEKGTRERDLLDAHGIEGTLLTRDEVLAKEPALKEDLVGGVYYPQEADCIPDRFVTQLADQLPSLGVHCHYQTSVNQLHVSGQSISKVETSAGMFQPENVVIAVGAWSVQLARKLGVQLSIQPGRGYSITVRQQPGLPRIPINLSEAKVAVTPWENKVRIAGTMELAGFDAPVNQKRMEAVLRGARNYLPDFRAIPPMETWAGMRPVTSDGLPLIGRSRTLPNLLMATGHGMLGITQSAVTGHLICDLIHKRDPLVCVAPFDPERHT